MGQAKSLITAWYAFNAAVHLCWVLFIWASHSFFHYRANLIRRGAVPEPKQTAKAEIA